MSEEQVNAQEADVVAHAEGTAEELLEADLEGVAGFVHGVREDHVLDELVSLKIATLKSFINLRKSAKAGILKQCVPMPGLRRSINFNWLILRGIPFVMTAGISTLTQMPPAVASEFSLGEIVDTGTNYLKRVSATFKLGKPPRFLIGIAGQRAPTGCNNTTIDGSYFCPFDETIVIEPLQLEAIKQASGPGGVVFALAHEYGHYLQWKQKISLKPPLHELQADCVAGAMLLSGETDAITAMGINKQDAYDMIAAAYQAGGGADHGTSEQRADAVVRGAKGGMNSCGVATLNKQSILIARKQSAEKNEITPSVLNLDKYERTRVQACRITTENPGKPFKWDDISSWRRLLYIQSERSTLRHGTLQLLGCLPVPLQGWTLGLTMPGALDPKIIRFNRCKPGALRPVACYQEIKSSIEKTRNGFLITTQEPLDEGALFSIYISGSNPSRQGMYQINLSAARTGTSQYSYIGSYTIEFL